MSKWEKATYTHVCQTLSPETPLISRLPAYESYCEWFSHVMILPDSKTTMFKIFWIWDSSTLRLPLTVSNHCKASQTFSNNVELSRTIWVGWDPSDLFSLKFLGSGSATTSVCPRPSASPSRPWLQVLKLSSASKILTFWASFEWREW